MKGPHTATARGISMRSLATMVAVLLVMFGLGAAPANAEQVLPTMGGPGGGETNDRCNAGTYLIGVQIKSGDWVDQISLICAEIHENYNNGTTTASYANVIVRSQHFGGTGGGAPVARQCAAGEHLQSLGVVPTTTSAILVRTMDLHCVLLDNKNHMVEAGNSSGVFPDNNHTQPCASGQAATGLHMRYGAYLDAAGLICDQFRPISTVGTPVATTPPPPSSAPPLSLRAPASAVVIFDEQNNYRKTCGTPMLLWSNALAISAQNWANNCRACHENDPTCPGGAANKSPWGENISFAYSTDPNNHAITDGSYAASSWICEWKNYNFSDPKFAGGYFTSSATDLCPPPPNGPGVNGHFTQVVWKGTTEIGCATKACTINGLSGTLWDCKYRAPGNFNVDTSLQGVTAAIAQQNLRANVSATCPNPHIK
jgi:hypothetical protein